MKIPQLEHGGNGVRASVVNQTLPCTPVDLRALHPALSRFQTTCCSKSSLGPDLRLHQLNLFDCATARSFCGWQGRKGTFAMIETVTAVLGLVSAGIFLAHAFEGYRSRA
jgi:hypothetical protein